MLVFTVVGNRPQFIKMSPVSRELKKQGIKEFVLHTGQHFDINMSDIFFSELEIPTPNQRLNINSKSHGEMTGEMIIAIEKILLEVRPDIILLYGDTNSTLAGAISAAKLKIPIAHVEAGPRLFNMQNPEEINRVCTDKLSTWLFCPDETSVQNLKEEGLVKNVFNVGDVMQDVFNFCRLRISENELNKFNVSKNNYVYITLHRAENTSSLIFFNQLFELLNTIDLNMVWPLHPRTLNALKGFKLYDQFKAIGNLIIVDPVGYYDSVALISNCNFIITDSGGVPKEGYYAGKKSILLFKNSPWPELVKSGWNYIGIEQNDRFKPNLVNNLLAIKPEENKKLFGNSTASNSIVNILKQEVQVSNA